MWLGISDIATEGRWVSAQVGTAVTYTPWSKGEPSGGKSENCGMLQERTGLWNDISCYKNLNYICEREGNSQVSSSNTSPGRLS